MYTGRILRYRHGCTYTYEGELIMIRITLAALGIAAAIITAPTSAATPAFCAPHDAGNIYIHACATGSGGSSTAARDAAQYTMKRLGITQADLDRVRAAAHH